MPASQAFALPEGYKNKHHVAPWWVGYLMLMPTRQLFQNPFRILGHQVKAGQTVLEAGPGMGFFTLPLAQMVGPKGRVIGVDCQEKMLERLRHRAENNQHGYVVETRHCNDESLSVGDLQEKVDLALAFNVVHEAKDPERMIGEMARSLKPGGRLFLSEPRGHVDRDVFLWEYGLAREAGLRAVDWPKHWHQMTVVMEKPVD